MTYDCIYDCIYDQRDIVRDISSRRRRFELKLFSSNNSVIKLLHAIGLSEVSDSCFLCACFFISFVCICHSVCAFYCVMR